MSGDLSLIEALKRYQASIGKASLSNAVVEHSPFDGLESELGKKDTTQNSCDQWSGNEFFGLEVNEIGHDIFKNPRAQDLEIALKKVAWPRTKCDITPTRKYQLFQHNLNTKASI